MINLIGTPRQIVAVPLQGEISAKDFLDAHSQAMLARGKNFGFDPVIYFQGELLSTKLNPMQKLERYAIVGAPQ
ncbi:MAG: hypothetical protein ABIR84_06365 [Candidatus Nitrotoga sp.]